MLRAQLHSFGIIHHFQRFLSTQVLWAHILFCYTTENTMQRDDFATKFLRNCNSIFISFHKLRLDSFANFKPCFCLTKSCALLSDLFVGLLISCGEKNFKFRKIFRDKLVGKAANFAGICNWTVVCIVKRAPVVLESFIFFQS